MATGCFPTGGNEGGHLAIARGLYKFVMEGTLAAPTYTLTTGSSSGARPSADQPPRYGHTSPSNA